jgi:hypothetical protein
MRAEPLPALEHVGRYIDIRPQLLQRMAAQKKPIKEGCFVAGLSQFAFWQGALPNWRQWAAVQTLAGGRQDVTLYGKPSVKPLQPVFTRPRRSVKQVSCQILAGHRIAQYL